MKPAGVKAPYHFGAIFEKNVVLKSHSKNSGGKKGFISDFCELWGAKGDQSWCFGITFGTFFEDFLDHRWIVKMKLPLARELNLQGWRGSEIIQISLFVEDLFQNLKNRCPRCNYLRFFCQKGSTGVPKRPPNS